MSVGSAGEIIDNAESDSETERIANIEAMFRDRLFSTSELSSEICRNDSSEEPDLEGREDNEPEYGGDIIPDDGDFDIALDAYMLEQLERMFGYE